MPTARLVLSFALAVAGCTRAPAPPPAAPVDTTSTDHATMDHAAHKKQMAASDTAFAAMQERGKTAMGVDQYASAHRFEPLADGGRIELQMAGADSAATMRIRAHLQDIARAFAAGDFATPGFVHAQNVPGTTVMAAKASAIKYVFAPLPRGGEVRMRTTDPDAVAAIHAFLAFQRREHK